MTIMFSRLKTLAVTVSAAAALALPLAPAGAAGGGHQEIHTVDWSFGGLFGQYDEAQLRRGFQVFQGACAACHGLERVAFRSLAQPGGPRFDEEAVKALAAEWPNRPLAGPNDDGEVVVDGELATRTPKASDPMLGPYRNDKAARVANNGALPPDLSLIVRARTFETHEPFWEQVPKMAWHMLTGYEQKGADYIYSVLTGYKEPPEGKEVGEGLYYNVAFPGNQLAMPQPIYEGGAVEYGENAGAENTLEQQAEDVTAFLAWAADPHLNARKQTGWVVMLYLLVTTILLWIGKQRLWARVKKQPA